MDINLSSIQKGITSFLQRYHFILFFVYVISGLSFGIWSIYGIIELSDQTNGYTSQTNSTTFDQATIERLRGLRYSTQETETLPTEGRVSPF
jgi:hypothetical protein